MQLAHLDDWTFFTGLAETGSMAEIARTWGVSPASVSKRLTALEQKLGVQLMRRSTRSLTLTDEGRRFLAGARKVLVAMQEAYDDAQPDDTTLRGKVSVHSTMGFGRTHIAPLMAEFAEIHPELHIDLQMSEHPLNISGSSFDLAIRVGFPADSALLGSVLLNQRRILVASPSYIDRQGKPDSPKDLGNHRCIVIRQDGSDFALWRFTDQQGNELSEHIEGSLTTNDGEVATSWCLAGQGILLRSEWQVAPLIKGGKLIQLLPDFQTPSAPVLALYESTALQSARVQVLVDFLRQRIGERLWV